MSEQTLPDQGYSEGTEPFMFWHPDDDTDYDFAWNGILGDPIQVEDAAVVEVVDLIPTSEGEATLGWFQAICQNYLESKEKNATQEIIAELDKKAPANNGPTISGGNVTIKWTDETGRVLASGTTAVFQDTGPITKDEKEYFREKEPEEPQTEDPNTMLERLLTPHEPPR